MKVKNCPWCGKRHAVLLAIWKNSNTPYGYFIHCRNCGYESGKWRFRFLAIWAWNREYKRLKRDPDGIRKYHLKGREF